MNYILDTDHLSLLQRGHEPLRQALQKLSSENIAITIISIEELLRGRLAQVHKASDHAARIKAYFWLWETVDFLRHFTILKYTEQADNQFEALRQQKVRIGTQDLRIASIALSYQAVLVTRNVKDFALVPNLLVEDWSVNFMA